MRARSLDAWLIFCDRRSFDYIFSRIPTFDTAGQFPQACAQAGRRHSLTLCNIYIFRAPSTIIVLLLWNVERADDGNDIYTHGCMILWETRRMWTLRDLFG